MASSPKQSEQGGCQGGYTLIEMVVVCALIATFLVVAMPALRPQSADNSLNTAARQLIWLVQGARHEARFARQPWRIEIDRERGRFCSRPDAAGSEATADCLKRVQLPPTVRLAGLTISGTALSLSAQPEIWISGRGHLEEMHLELEDSERRKVVLHFSPFQDEVTVSGQVTGQFSGQVPGQAAGEG